MLFYALFLSPSLSPCLVHSFKKIFCPASLFVGRVLACSLFINFNSRLSSLLFLSFFFDFFSFFSLFWIWYSKDVMLTPTLKNRANKSGKKKREREREREKEKMKEWNRREISKEWNVSNSASFTTNYRSFICFNIFHSFSLSFSISHSCVQC